MSVSRLMWFVAVLIATAAGAPAQMTDAAAREEAREERQIILRAADQLEMQQKNIEALQSQMEGLRKAVATLQEENAKLRGELAGVVKLVEGADAKRAEEQKALLAEVAKLVKESTAKSSPAPAPTATNDPQKGFYHVVEEGQTLNLIAKAYRDAGVNVSVEQIRQANNIGSDNVIRVGQKLFIPKS